MIKTFAYKDMFGVWGEGRGWVCVVGLLGEWVLEVRGLIPLRLIVPTLILSKSKFKMSLLEKCRL